VDYESIAKRLNTTVQHVSIMIRSADKDLMIRSAEEAANATLHSNQLKHEIRLADKSRFKD
jgi:transcriptional regulator